MAILENTRLDDAAIQALRSQLRGPLITPEDPAYESARQLYNGMIDKRPRLIAFMMDDEAQGRIQATYGENYQRLASVKAAYDPRNLFRVNQNILPSVA